MDMEFVMQALSPGTTNALPCESGHLSLNNPDVAIYCTDFPAQKSWCSPTKQTPQRTASLAVLDETTGELLAVFCQEAR